MPLQWATIGMGETLQYWPAWVDKLLSRGSYNNDQGEEDQIEVSSAHSGPGGSNESRKLKVIGNETIWKRVVYLVALES